jgi:hypothetical protein
MSKKLFAFDFDGTLINTPLEEPGILEWEKKTGKKYTHRGWWSKEESLDLQIFQPEIIPWVFEHFKNSCSGENYVFVATGRVNKLKDKVKSVLDFNQIFQRNKFGEVGYDDLFCNTGGETFLFKTKLFEKIINDNPNAEEFIMFDDREEHLDKFLIWAKKQPIEIKIYNVNLKKLIS